MHIPAAYIIVNQSHLNPLTALINKRIGNKRSQWVFGKNIHIYMYVLLGTTYVLHQLRDKLIAISTDVNKIILERQCQVLIHEQVYQRFVLVRQTKVLLLGKLQHRTLGELIHRTLTNITLSAMIDAKEQIEHYTNHRHEVYHQRPCHSLSGLAVVHHHMNYGDDYQHVVDYKYNVQPVHLPSFLANAL